MTNKNIRLLSAFFVLFSTSSTVIADQTSDVSVFQPAKDVLANIYIEQSELILKTDEQELSSLAKIRGDYLTLYPNQLYILNDSDDDGMIEISALKSVNAPLNEFCYSVYNYNTDTKLYENDAELISCRKGDLEPVMDEQRSLANANVGSKILNW